VVKLAVVYINRTFIYISAKLCIMIVYKKDSVSLERQFNFGKAKINAVLAKHKMQTFKF